MSNQKPLADPLAAVRQPVATANGLPNAHYTDPGVFTEEADALLKSTWAGLAVASDVPEPTRLRRISYAVFCLKKKKQSSTYTPESSVIKDNKHYTQNDPG